MKVIIRYLLFTVLTGICSVANAQFDTSVVYFDFDKHQLTAEANATLGKIIRPNLYSLKIFGHTDQLGSVAYNERLSDKRANAVKAFFLQGGVDPLKIQVVKGFGEHQPAVDQLDAVSRKANRRVVIIADYELTAKDSVIIDDNTSSIITTPSVPAGARKTVKENLIKELTDTSTKAGDNLVLRNINFYGGRHVFLPEAYPALHELLDAMQRIPTLEIEIQGHICCMDSEADGLDIDTGEPFLSYNRARAVYEYLAARGIDRKRMTFKGFGHRFPIIAFEESEAERTTNRRVEIRILKK